MRQVKNETNREFMGTETLFSINCIEMRQFRAENQERQIDHVSVLLEVIFKKPSIFLSIFSHLPFFIYEQIVRTAIYLSIMVHVRVCSIYSYSRLHVLCLFVC